MIERTIQRNALKYAASTTMFCPLCERVLDAASTVNVEFGRVDRTVCAHCWDSEVLPAYRRLGVIERCTVLDGRILFKPSRRTVGTGSKIRVSSGL